MSNTGNHSRILRRVLRLERRADTPFERHIAPVCCSRWQAVNAMCGEALRCARGRPFAIKRLWHAISISLVAALTPPLVRRPSLVSRKRAKTCAAQLPSLASERRVGDESGVLSKVIVVADRTFLLKLMLMGCARGCASDISNHKSHSMPAKTMLARAISLLDTEHPRKPDCRSSHLEPCGFGLQSTSDDCL